MADSIIRTDPAALVEFGIMNRFPERPFSFMMEQYSLYRPFAFLSISHWSAAFAFFKIARQWGNASPPPDLRVKVPMHGCTPTSTHALNRFHALQIAFCLSSLHCWSCRCMPCIHRPVQCHKKPSLVGFIQQCRMRCGHRK